MKAQAAKKVEQTVAVSAQATPASRPWIMAAVLVVLWVLLYLPNLRTNPNWYGDEGEWMDKCWTFIHGTPRVGPIVNDFVFPYPYPPLYMLVTGALLRVFGNDLVVARALGAVTALAAAGILFWIGTRLRNRTFGFLCALAFLVYPESVMNFRWVRSHPMAGTLALAAVGFLVLYVQEKRLRDIALAGAMCALATATHYMTYPLIGAVVATAAVVNWRDWRQARAWVHVAVAGAAAGSYAALFVLWYVLAHAGGWGQLMAQVARLTSVASNETRPTMAGEVARFFENVWNLGFKTPTHGPPPAWSGHDVWLMVATAGFVFLPVKDWRLRLWLPFWLLVLMYGVFKKLNNVPLFFYPATVFLPLMAVGFGGILAWVGVLARKFAPKQEIIVLVLAAVIGLGPFAWQSLTGALDGFQSKIDLWTQRSVGDAEAAMQYVNDHTTTDDFVLVPKQIYWLVKKAQKSMLTYCARYDGVVNDMPVPVLIPKEMYWFDCRYQNAKYLVLDYGVDANRYPVGIDAVYTFSLKGVKEIIESIQNENWPVAFASGEYKVLANPRFVNP